MIGHSDAADDYLTVLDATTGAQFDQIQIGANLALYGYGAIDIDEDAQKGYFEARSQTGSTAITGAFSYTYETPTPTPLAVSSGVWGLYE